MLADVGYSTKEMFAVDMTGPPSANPTSPLVIRE
jgi:hypothetical protein